MDTDSSDSEKVWVYPVQYASVTDLEKLLGQVFQTTGGNRNRNNNNRNNANGDANNDMRVSQIVGDERTNKLIIVADERSYEKMKRLILKLDVEIPDSGKINVVHLQNSEANEIYTALNQIISDLTSKNGSNRSNNNANNSQRTLQGEDISVVASESTNDLIVVASPRDFLAIKKRHQRIGSSTSPSLRRGGDYGSQPRAIAIARDCHARRQYLRYGVGRWLLCRPNRAQFAPKSFACGDVPRIGEHSGLPHGSGRPIGRNRRAQHPQYRCRRQCATNEYRCQRPLDADHTHARQSRSRNQRR